MRTGLLVSCFLSLFMLVEATQSSRPPFVAIQTKFRPRIWDRSSPDDPLTVRTDDCCFSIRGGGGEDEKDKSIDEEKSNKVEPSHQDANATITTADRSARAQAPQKKGWFREFFLKQKMASNNRTRAPPTLSNTTSILPNTTTTTTPTVASGGALVKARPAKSKQPWWQATTSFFVQTWESQYVKGDDKNSGETKKKRNPSRSDEATATNTTTTTTSETDNTPSPTTNNTTAKKAAEYFPSDLWERIRRNVWGRTPKRAHPATNSTTNTASRNNATALRRTNRTAKLPHTQRKRLPTSRYESSGGWRALDYVTSLGMSSSHPGWRLSKRLRPFRKRASKLTGLHGVISGKPSLNQTRSSRRAPVAAPWIVDHATTVDRNQSAINQISTTSSSSNEVTGRNDTVIGVKSRQDDEEETDDSATESPPAEQSHRKHHKNKRHHHHKKKGQLDAKTIVEEKKKDSSPINNTASSKTLANATIIPTYRLDYVSTGLWQPIDRFFSLGLAQNHPRLRVSSRLRPLRKAVARTTGWHGALSGKPHRLENSAQWRRQRQQQFRRMRSRLRESGDDASREMGFEMAANQTKQTRRSFWGGRRKTQSTSSDNSPALTKAEQERVEEEIRRQQVEAIDKRIQEAQRLLGKLACEKDILQRRHNPFWNYTTTSETMSREFVFPPDDLVDEYLEMLFASGRLVKLNHTDLWRNNFEDDDDEDEFSEPSESMRPQNGEAGSWFLRNGLGEKIGASSEIAAYKAVGKGIMGGLARALAGLHGINVMGYSDIRLNTEQTPALPPSAGLIAGGSRNYAQDAFQDAIRRGSRKRPRSSDFLQKAAVVETLTSQAQIAMPLLKMFPMSWQRALLGNILVLVTAVMSDFCEGLEVQVLGHKLSLSFSPITEEDMMRNMVRDSLQKRPTVNTEQFEAAVLATANDIAKSLNFLDRWHHKALGAGNLKLQIATLIARLVLTLANDVLTASQMNLWTEQAGGPTLLPGFEFRTSPNYLRDEETIIDAC